METSFIHATYMMCVEKAKVNLCEILRAQLVENLERIKKIRNNQFKFQSLINYMFFHLIKRFPFMTIVEINNNDKYSMEKIPKLCKIHHIDKIKSSIDFIVKKF